MSYFYLYRLDSEDGSKVIDAIKIFAGRPPIAETDIAISWSSDERFVFLRIADQICAVFDTDGPRKYGGGYAADGMPRVPSEILARLTT